MTGRSPSGRAGRPTAQAPAGLGDTATIPNADPAITAATERRQEILRTIPKLVAELKTLDAFINTWCDMVGVPRPTKAKRRKYARSPNMPREDVARECLSILNQCGRPLDRKDLLGALSDRGIEIYGKDPAMVLSTMLWRSRDTIVRTRDGYMPASRIEARSAGTGNTDPARKGESLTAEGGDAQTSQPSNGDEE
jgi:hypothetical protein